jgi:hypothetical protein
MVNDSGVESLSLLIPSEPLTRNQPVPSPIRVFTDVHWDFDKVFSSSVWTLGFGVVKVKDLVCPARKPDVVLISKLNFTLKFVWIAKIGGVAPGRAAPFSGERTTGAKAFMVL